MVVARRQAADQVRLGIGDDARQHADPEPRRRSPGRLARISHDEVRNARGELFDVFMWLEEGEEGQHKPDRVVRR
jgi:hypothetical protein